MYLLKKTKLSKNRKRTALTLIERIEEEIPHEVLIPSTFLNLCIELDWYRLINLICESFYFFFENNHSNL